MRKLNELTAEELGEVFSEHAALQGEVGTELYREMLRNTEKNVIKPLEPFILSYNISGTGVKYIFVDDKVGFLKAVTASMLSEEGKVLLVQAKSLETVSEKSDDMYLLFRDKVQAIADDIVRVIMNDLGSTTNYSMRLSYLKEMLPHNFDKYYVDNELKLYEYLGGN